MILSGKQALLMFRILVETLDVDEDENYFSVNFATRKSLIHEITNQQSETLVNLSKLKISAE